VTSSPQAQHGATAFDSYDGAIGGAILRRFKVIFDYSRNQMILDPDADFAALFQTDTSGLVIGSQGPDMKIVSIRHVLAETPAAAAGMREGDAIISVNGAEAHALGVEGIQNLLCHAGTYRFQLSRGQQKLELTINTNQQLY
jgi:C-terminal processing protease CtpA/Prc